MKAGRGFYSDNMNPKKQPHGAQGAGGCALILMILYLDHKPLPHCVNWYRHPRLLAWTQDSYRSAIKRDALPNHMYGKVGFVRGVSYGHWHPVEGDDKPWSRGVEFDGPIRPSTSSFREDMETEILSVERTHRARRGVQRKRCGENALKENARRISRKVSEDVGGVGETSKADDGVECNANNIVDEDIHRSEYVQTLSEERVSVAQEDVVCVVVPEARVVMQEPGFGVAQDPGFGVAPNPGFGVAQEPGVVQEPGGVDHLVEHPEVDHETPSLHHEEPVVEAIEFSEERGREMLDVGASKEFHDENMYTPEKEHNHSEDSLVVEWIGRYSRERRPTMGTYYRTCDDGTKVTPWKGNKEAQTVIDYVLSYPFNNVCNRTSRKGISAGHPRVVAIEVDDHQFYVHELRDNVKDCKHELVRIVAMLYNKKWQGGRLMLYPEYMSLASYIDGSGNPVFDVSHDVFSSSFHGMVDFIKGAEYKKCSMFFLPIYHRDHWFCYVFDYRDRRIAVLDSIHSINGLFHETISKQIVKMFADVMEVVEGGMGVGILNWEVVDDRLPTEPNISESCGVMMLLAIPLWNGRWTLPPQMVKSSFLGATDLFIATTCLDIVNDAASQLKAIASAEVEKKGVKKRGRAHSN